MYKRRAAVGSSSCPVRQELAARNTKNPGLVAHTRRSLPKSKGAGQPPVPARGGRRVRAPMLSTGGPAATDGCGHGRLGCHELQTPDR
eukprot:13192857-Alexandrium_andersonii.AAC.1